MTAKPTVNPVKTETIGDGILALGDCLDWFPSLNAGSLQLVAVDPPFLTGKKQVGGGENPATFPDRWKGGKDEYLSWLM